MTINKLINDQVPFQNLPEKIDSEKTVSHKKVQELVKRALSHIALLPVHVTIAIVKGTVSLFKKEEKPVLPEQPTPFDESIVEKLEELKLTHALSDSLLENTPENRTRFYELVQKVVNLEVKILREPVLKGNQDHQALIDAAQANLNSQVQSAKIAVLTESKLIQSLEQMALDISENRIRFYPLVEAVVSSELNGDSKGLLAAQKTLNLALRSAKMYAITERKLSKWLKNASIEVTSANKSRYFDKVKRVVVLKMEKTEHPELAKDKNHRLARKVAKGILSVSLDPSSLKPIGVGVHGSAWVNSFKGKHLGVFKPNPQSMDERETIYKQLFSQDPYLNKGNAAEAASERAAFLVAQALKLDQVNVAAVELLELGGKKGAFLTFEKGKMAQDYTMHMELKKSYSKEELYIFQSFAIFDYIIGNLDRKDDNWLVVWHQNQLKSITPIDNANSFPVSIPQNWNAKSIHRWKDLSISDIPFTKEMVEFIKQNITLEAIERVMDRIDNDAQIQAFYPNGKRFLSTESKIGMRDRCVRLQRLITSVRNPTPAMMEISDGGFPLLETIYQAKFFLKKLKNEILN